ncbi:MAG TPA: outer membrane lipoprotein-sorting protein [Bryobacteraceae bacterium]|jgi:outer membrane lipoprotein-sorting protein|nr:outer membrane lipoprotein-sorting protein [Bryobacteraceae bacterium]
MNNRWRARRLASAALLVAAMAQAQDARQIVEEAQKRSESASQRYEGILQVIGAENRIATKRWVFERLGSFGRSKALLRFTAPPEVKGVALLIMNHPDRASDQWMWRPAIGREQRIALQDRSTRFFGTDFSFEDLEERDVNQFDYKLLPDEGGQWKIESRPRKPSQYSYSYLWIDKSKYTIRKAEMYNKSGLVRVIDYRDFAQVRGIWTARTTEVLDVKRKSRTILKFDKLEYDIPLKEDLFTVEALRRES